jgi:hypothetical protein
MKTESSGCAAICGGYGDRRTRAAVIDPAAAAVPDFTSLRVKGIPVPVTSM